MRADLVLLTLALLTAALTAQVSRFEVEPTGRREFKVLIEAKSVSTLELLSTLATLTGFQLTNESGPETMVLIDTQTISCQFADRNLADTVRALAGAVGIWGTVDRSTGRIILRTLPATDSEEAFEFFRRDAIDSLIAAYGGDEKSEREEKLLLANADLYIAGGEYGQALDALTKYLDGYQGQIATAPRACILAARCALELGNTTQAIIFCDIFVESWPRHALEGKARIIRAQALLAADDVMGAIFMLNSMSGAQAKLQFDDRDSLIAEIMLAEIYHDHEEPARAVA
ncbi:MAG: hypothetical protein KDB53_20610, partial [Planctomycetes bacterium]|nr:hypothetical protein [Planctomycetota bacterium]